VITKLHPHPLETNDITKDGTSEASENAGVATLGLIHPFHYYHLSLAVKLYNDLTMNS
jgi:hypothetical protein